MALTNESPFVVCIDSDGCAMDTMDIKHIRFFGPLAAKYFEIKNQEVYLEEWNRVNLFSGNENTVKAVIDKLEGKSEFKGTPNELVWTEKWQAKL